MSQLNSSTSSSELSVPPATRPQWARDLVVIGGFLIASLAAADVTINVVFAFPSNPNEVPSGTKAYFEYGRSIEGKLARIVGTSDQNAAPIASAGWLSTARDTEPKRPKAGSDLLLANYGMSYSVQVAAVLAELDPRLTIRNWGGPQAPPSCVYAYYLADRGKHEADVVMLTILSRRVSAMEATNGMTSGFEAPAPFTFPRFIADDSGGIETLEPTIRTLADLRTALADPQRRAAFIDEMRRNDAYYASYLFDRSVFDSSALARMVRRALAHGRDRFVESLCSSEAGFREDSRPIRALRVIIKKFAASVRSDGQLPIVLLIDSRGSGDHLYKALAGVVETNDIPCISTNNICDADDPTNFIADGHFTTEANRKIAQAVAELMTARLKDRGKPRHARATTVPGPAPVRRY